MFNARRQAPIEYRHRGRGGPVTVYANALHAALYGLPPNDEPLPTDLDALLLHIPTSPEQEAAVLHQVADQLRNAAEIIVEYRHKGLGSRLTHGAAEQLSDAHRQATRIAELLDQLAPALASLPTTDTPDTRAPLARDTAPPPLPRPTHTPRSR